jgi:hypothetical protein
MVSLSSVGELPALDVAIASLDLYDSDGELRAELPILDVVEVDTGEAIHAELPPGDERLVRITFRGPANPHDFLAPLNGDDDGLYPYPGEVHIHVDSSNAPNLTIVSTLITPISDIDT